MKNKSKNNENNWIAAINMKVLSNDIGLFECNNKKQFSKKKRNLNKMGNHNYMRNIYHIC